MNLGQVYRLVIMASTLTGWIFIGKLYSLHPIGVALVIFTISPCLMQVIARALEGRWLWPPKTQYRAFFWRDTVMLPLIGIGITVSLQQLPNSSYWFFQWWWAIVAVGLSFLMSLTFSVSDAEGYSYRQLNSPTKVYHDLFVYPVLSFLFFLGAPALFYPPINGATLLALIGFFGWAALGVSDMKIDRPNAHIDFEWPQLDRENALF